MTVDSRRLMAIIPHPDDESFFMGGTLAKYAGAAQVRLVAVADGSTGKRARQDATGRWSADPSSGGDPQARRALSRLREAELLAAARELGVQDLAWLGWAENLWELAQFLRCAIRRQIRSFDPHVVISLNEAGTTRNPDHCWSALASYQAILDLAGDPMSLERFYTVSLPEAGERFDYWGELVTHTATRVEIDVAEMRQRSLAACHSHRSQAHWVSYLDSVGLLAPEKETFVLRWSRGNRGSNRTDLFAEPLAGDAGAPVMPMPATETAAYTSDQPDLAETIFSRNRHLCDRSMRGVILASGRGTRMNNPALPKSMELVAGRPMLHYPLSALAEANVDERPVVVTGPGGGHIHAAFAGLDYVDQPLPLGTGHALKQARQRLQQSGARHVCVIYGDMPLISAASIRRLASCHYDSGNALTLATTRVADFTGDGRYFERHGRILRDADGRIAGIVEFCDANEEQRAIIELNPGLFCFDTNWLWPALDRLTPHNRQKEYYLTDLVKIAVADGAVLAEVDIPATDGLGVNSRDDLERVEALLSSERKLCDGGEFAPQGGS